MVDSSTKLSPVYYYAREQYHRHVYNSVLEVIEECGPEPILLFWKGYSIIMENRLAEGMSELESIIDKKGVVLCAPLLLIYAHKKCKTVDREAVNKLEAKVRTDRTSCGEKDLYNAGMFLWLSGRHDKAREYVDRVLKLAPESKEGLALKGWIDITSGRETLMKKSIKYFEEALAGPDHPKLVEALFGKARFFLIRHNFTLSVEVLNQAVATFPDFLPALIEKMKTLLALQDWDQTLDTAHQCLSEHINCIEATRVLALSLLVRDGDYEKGAERVSDILQLIDRFEPSNHWLYYDASIAFARLSGENKFVLEQTMALLERAISLAPNNAVYITELAYQYGLKGQHRESLQTYRKAFNLDETSVSALAGIIHCQIEDGLLSEAEQQLEFLTEVQSTIGKQAHLLHLNALLGQKKQLPSDGLINELHEAVDIHCATVKGTPLSEKYYYLINPHFLYEITKAMMVYAPTEPASSLSLVQPVLHKALRAIDTVVRCAPGMAQALFLLAKIKFLSGEINSAQTILQRCIDCDGNSLEAHLLMAQIYLHRGNIKQCSNSLELALSRNFEVQGYAVYHLINALAKKRSGALQDTLASLQMARTLITTKENKQQNQQSLLPALNQSEQVTVYLELASVLSELGQTHEAAKVMQDAINNYAGTPEEIRMSIANANLALSRGDPDHALTLLKTVTNDRPYFIEAKEKMAQIYFKEKNDKKLYISCYKDLFDDLPGTPTALLLGNAYMKIQEPELAVEVFESALKCNPRDGVLASKVGQALVKTHLYNKAINFYEAALKTENQQFLRKDLAELYMKLKHFDRAEKTLMVALDHGSQEVLDLSVMMEDTKHWLLLAKVHQRANKPSKALGTLSSAKDVQARVLKRVGTEQPDMIQTQKLLAASICCQMAEHNVEANNHSEAIKLYKEALNHDDDHSEARLALADLHLQRKELEACEHECITLLRTDPDNEQATVMRAALLAHKGDYTKAAEHFKELLEKNPDNFEALARLIELSRRAGQLEKSEPFLEQASKACSRSAYVPGLSYCRGLFKRYQHSMNDALQCFNHARKDSDWGEKALFNMIEICLNPDDETLGGETFKLLEGEATTSQSQEDQTAVRTAEKLIKEVLPKSVLTEQKLLVMENYILLATKSKQNAERAVERFMEMASTEHDSTRVLLGMATAYMILKQVPRARNQLKRIAKMSWNSQDAEEFEKSWLLLADIYIQNGKYDMAVELLKKCISYNRSCCRAWEYLGFISEKEQSYKDAATNYENAWKYSNFSNPNIGYKLAFNYLKDKRFIDAISVCHKVLENHPTYPKIQREVLDKARLSLRP